MKRWVIAIVSLLGINVAATVVLATVANNGDTHIIPGYYDRAVHYNDAIARAARERELGWHLGVSERDGIIAVDVSDVMGKPIADAHVSMTGYARAHADHEIVLELAGTGNGRYVSHDAMTRTGWHDFALVVARGADRIDRRIAIEAR
jgi:nitrogen fixation protein FixH